MKELLSNIRFYILLISISISIFVYFYIKNTVPSGTIQTIKLTQTYALLSVLYLYVTLLATPVIRYFKFLPFRSEYIKSRRALGISAFYFGALHAYLAFFKQLGGFEGLGFLSSKYLIAITLSFTALVIFTIMALTAFDYVVDRIGFKKWKVIHRFVYLAGMLVLIHAMMLGTHFSDLSSLIPKIFFSALSFLLILEAKRFDDYLKEKFGNLPWIGISGMLVLGLIVYFLPNYVFTSIPKSSLGIHSQHILQAQQATDTKLNVVMSPLDNLYANRKTNLTFRVFDSKNGEQINNFTVNQEKLMHLIIISDDLSYFDHVHPELKDGDFIIDYTFPKSGIYRLYTDFQPTDLVEQQFSFRVNVGNVKEVKSVINKDLKLTDNVENIKANLVLPKSLSSKDLSQGRQTIGVKFIDTTTNEDVRSIGTYLGAFGHLVMIKTETYDYVHVHPKQAYIPFKGETTGPLVEFSPLGLYGEIKPGVYKVYGQFNISDRLYTFDFFVRVE